MTKINLGEPFSLYPTLHVGDAFTIAVRPKWWERPLIWARLRKAPEPKRFVVSWTNEQSGRAIMESSE